MADSVRALGAVNPKQLALIAVLAVVLFSVLVVQLGGRGGASDKPNAAERPAPDTAVIGAAAVPSPSAAGTVQAEAANLPDRRPWPKFSAEAAGAYDPFALPRGWKNAGVTGSGGDPETADAARTADLERRRKAAEAARAEAERQARALSRCKPKESRPFSAAEAQPRRSWVTAWSASATWWRAVV